MFLLLLVLFLFNGQPRFFEHDVRYGYSPPRPKLVVLLERLHVVDEDRMRAQRGVKLRVRVCFDIVVDHLPLGAVADRLQELHGEKPKKVFTLTLKRVNLPCFVGSKTKSFGSFFTRPPSKIEA